MIIKSIYLTACGTNCYLLADEAAKLCAIIDPGVADPKILEEVRGEGWTVAAVLLTHGHYDHTRGIPALRPELPGASVYLHPGDMDMKKPFFYIEEMGELTPLADGEQIKIGSLDVEVIHTPGHSAGSVTFKAGDALFTGDTLFKGSMGRTDLPGGGYEDIMASLKRLGDLPGEYKVLPGHMDASTLNFERANNYYLREAMGN